MQALRTAGDGYWSKVAKTVLVTKLEFNVDGDWGELRVYFDMNSWDIRSDGLIYTDTAFFKGVETLLFDIGFTNYSDFDYSEQGMQEDDYVSFGMGQGLISEILRTDIFELNV